MDRFERRKIILDGRSNHSFSPGQYYIEGAVRGRLARKVRQLLRRMEPVVLITPRWSGVSRFLDDLALDLLVGEPKVHCRPLSLAPLQGRTVHESWTWLVHALAGFCHLEVDGPVAQAVSRHGFRHVMAGLFDLSCRGPRRALLVHGVEHLHVEARDDLFRVFEDHVRKSGPDRRVNLLFAGSVDAPSFTIRNAQRLVLIDYGRNEAVEALVEYIGPVDRTSLNDVVDLVGGVPELLAAIGDSGVVDASRSGLLRALGPLADEVRGAVAIVSAVDGLVERLESVFDAEVAREEPRWDRMLVRAGLVEQASSGQARRVRVRAPMFAQLAVHGVDGLS